MSTFEARKRAQKKYDTEHKEEFRRYYLKMNKALDKDVIDRLSEVGNIQGYIKELIRKDIQG